MFIILNIKYNNGNYLLTFYCTIHIKFLHQLWFTKKLELKERGSIDIYVICVFVCMYVFFETEE